VDIPLRTVTDAYPTMVGETRDIVFDADLGEVIDGHRVVVPGICFGGPARGLGSGEATLAESALHHEFVPALTKTRTSDTGERSRYAASAVSYPTRVFSRRVRMAFR
jgi:hypothetical protein